MGVLTAWLVCLAGHTEQYASLRIRSQGHAFVCGPTGAGAQQIGGLGSNVGHGAHLQRHNLNNNSYNYTGGQYAKYGKRY